MPEKLYISNDFYVEFIEDGTITNNDTMLYGKSDKGELKGFLLSYDYKKGNRIDLWLNEGEGLNINLDRLLNPFLTILKQSSFKE